MGNFGYGSYGGYGGFGSGGQVIGSIVCLVLAIAGGIVLYCTFLSKKNEGRFKGFLGWLYNTLSFKSLLLELILKITYLIGAGFLTLYSFVVLFTTGNFGYGLLGFLGTFILGNIIWRIIYEFMLLLIIICRNTSDISKNTKKQTDRDSSQ